MQKEDLRREGDAKGYPVLESGRCVPGPNRTRPDSPRGIINQNIYTQGCASVRRVAPTLRLIDYPMSRSIRYFGIQGVLYDCPLVLARREKGIKRMKEIRLVRRRSRRQASWSLVIYTSQRVNVRAFFILPLLLHDPLTPTVGHPRHFRFLDDCTVTLVPALLWALWRAALLGAS